MLRQLIAVSSLVVALITGCYEITEDKSREVGAILASVTQTSSVSFHFKDKDDIEYDKNAYSYNCFTYTAGDNNKFGVDGWYLTLGYPGSDQRDVKLLITNTDFSDSTTAARDYTNTSHDLYGRIFLSDHNGYGTDDAYTFTLTVTNATEGRVQGTFSGTMKYLDVGNPGTITSGTFNACVRAR